MRKTILIVDDCLVTATPLEIALAAMENMQVLLLSSAADALKILANPDFQVSAIVTDLHLPHMNGFELIEAIRKNGPYASVPIVLVTGESNPVTRSRAFEKGASAYFPKPYSPADIRHELERLIHES